MKHNTIAYKKAVGIHNAKFTIDWFLYGNKTKAQMLRNVRQPCFLYYQFYNKEGE